MNLMSKFFVMNILLITIVSTKFSFGQKPVIGINLGIALSNSSIEYADPDGYRPKTSTRTGAMGGVYLDFKSGDKMIIRPGIEVVSKGFRDENNYGIIYTFIDFPLSILYKINFTKAHIIIGGGPSIGVPIKDFYAIYSQKTEFSVNGLIGYELAMGPSINLNYTYGLSNASKNRDFLKKLSNRYLGITLGYSF